jgi:hypothetical protein
MTDPRDVPEADERRRRLAEALRANLRRRKGRARARADAEGADPDGAETGDAAATDGPAR